MSKRKLPDNDPNSEIIADNQRQRLAWLGFIILSFFLIWHGFGVVKEYIYTSRQLSCIFTRLGEITRHDRIHLLINESPPQVLCLLIGADEITVVTMPDELIEPANNPVACPLETVKRQVEQRLALPIDGYLLLDDIGDESGTNARRRLQSWRILTQHRTDLSPRQLWSIWRWSQTVRSNRATGIWLTGPHYYDPEQDRWLTEGVDTEIINNLYDPAIRQEQVRVAILNGSGQAGAASQRGRYVSNLGAQLVAVENLGEVWCQALELDCSQGTIEQSVFLVTERVTESSTFRRLESVFGLEYTVREQLPPQADMYWIVGEK